MSERCERCDATADALEHLAIYVAGVIAMKETDIRRVVGDSEVDAIQRKCAAAITLANLPE